MKDYDRNGKKHGIRTSSYEVQREYQDDGYWHSYTDTVDYPCAWYWHGKELKSYQYEEQEKKLAGFMKKIPTASFQQVQKWLTNKDFITDLVGDEKVEKAFHKNRYLTYRNYLQLSRKKNISKDVQKILFDLSVHKLEQDQREKEEARVLKKLKNIKKLQVFAEFLTEENLQILGVQKIFETVTFPVEKVLPIAQERLSGKNLSLANKVLKDRFLNTNE